LLQCSQQSSHLRTNCPIMFVMGEADAEYTSSVLFFKYTQHVGTASTVQYARLHHTCYLWCSISYRSCTMYNMRELNNFHVSTEFPKSSRRVPTEFLKISQRVPRKFPWGALNPTKSNTTNATRTSIRLCRGKSTLGVSYSGIMDARNE
jgi:hypothetical protein